MAQTIHNIKIIKTGMSTCQPLSSLRIVVDSVGGDGTASKSPVKLSRGAVATVGVVVVGTAVVALVLVLLTTGVGAAEGVGAADGVGTAGVGGVGFTVGVGAVGEGAGVGLAVIP
jgi:hypothetical protein